jgi:hypothetical protein
MTNYIKVSNLDNKTYWQKELTNEEFQTVKTYVEGKNTVNLIRAAVIPVRTNNFKNFSKDFFLPTVVNHALKVQHEVGEVFAILGALVLDVTLFPIRLFTCIPRVISNAKQKENALCKYLKAEGVSKRLLASDHVRVILEWEVPNTFPKMQWVKDSVVHKVYGNTKCWSEQNVNFIELPSYKGSGVLRSGSVG